MCHGTTVPGVKQKTQTIINKIVDWFKVKRRKSIMINFNIQRKPEN